MDGSVLLEREQLLEQLSSHASAAARGSGRMVFVGGEAGAGKTSLVEAVRSKLPEGFVSLYGACDPLAAPRPLAPLLDIAPGVSEGFRQLVSSGGDRHALFTAFAEGLLEADTTRLVVFEDLHWSDGATLDLLRFVGRRIATWRSIFLVTYRDDEIGAVHPVRRLLGDLASTPNVHRLHVPPLSIEAVRTLIGDRGLDPHQVHGRTGGNPYFVTEVLAMEGDGVPVKAGDAVLARVARLSTEAMRALELCALTKQHVEVGRLSRLTSPDAVDECCMAGLLSARHDRLSYRHEIAREAVENSIPAGRRRVLHAELLGAYELDWAPESTDPASQDRPDRHVTAELAGRWAVLAFHAHEAGDAGAVLRYAVAAGRLALRLRAYREARMQLARALPHCGSLPPEDRARLFEDHGRVCFLVDDMEGAAASRREAAALWQVAGDLEGQVRNLRELSALLDQQGRHREAEPLAAQVHELAESLPEESYELAAVYNDRAWPVPGRGVPSKPWVDRAAASAKASGNRPALAWSHTMTGYLHLQAGRVPVGRRHLAVAVSVAANGDLEDVRADLEHDAGALLSSRLRFRAAEAHLDSALAVARDHDLDCTLNYATAAKARSQLYLGRWDEAAAYATWVLERPDASIVPRLRALTTLGLLRVRRGDPEASDLLDEALDLASRQSVVATIVPVRAARAEAALTRDDPETALLEATADLQMAMDDGTGFDVAQLGYLIWKSGGTPPFPLPSDHPLTWQVNGRPLAAGSRWRRLGLPFEEARAYAESDDVPHLLSALRIFTQLGAGPARTRTAESLRRLGARGIPRGPRPDTVSNVAGLTAREMQVLRLLATGMRNADIAARNHVSHRTVDNQVSSLLAKLEARSRGEAVAKAYRIGIIARHASENEIGNPTTAT